MSSYWDNLERFLNEHWGESTMEEITDALIGRGWAPTESRNKLVSLLSRHNETHVYDDDIDGDSHCKCGKWLEYDNYEWPDHVSSILGGTELLTPGRPWEVSK